MYIVIAGGGIAGSVLAMELANFKHDVVVVERDRESCEHLYARTGVVTVNGSATDVAALEEAGIRKADIAIGALYLDSDNLTFALLAHSRGVPKIIVKMRDPAYADAYRVAGVDTICDMIAMMKTRIINEIENPNVRLITAIEGGKAKLVTFEIPQSWPSEGIAIDELMRLPALSKGCVVAGVLDTETEHILVPSPSHRVRPKDMIFVVVHRDDLKDLSDLMANGKACPVPASLVGA